MRLNIPPPMETYFDIITEEWDEVATVHIVKRCSEKNHRWLGVCVMCGQDGLNVYEMQKACHNPRRMTFAEAIAEVVYPKPH